MKKSSNITDSLVMQAHAAATGTETGLRHAASARLKALRGTEPDARDVPRRREKPRLKPIKAKLKRAKKKSIQRLAI